jgi:hypothetical protein
MASALGRVVSFPARQTVRAGAAVGRAASDLNASVTRLTEVQPESVDDWGRDPAFVRSVTSAARLRWDVTVGGEQHLARRRPALIVVSTRRMALTPIFSALAISRSVGRPVRFVGRPDTAPLGALARRLGGLLDHPDEVAGALAAGELVVVGAHAGSGLRDVGEIDHTIVGAALAAGASVHPCAAVSSPIGRAARVEIGAAARPPRRRRGPLAELELADRVRSDIAELLDGLGDLPTGTPLDWLPLSGLGGA